MDGISVILILLTTGMMPIVFLSSWTTDKRVKRGMAYVPQEDAVFLKLSVHFFVENPVIDSNKTKSFIISS